MVKAITIIPLWYWLAYLVNEKWKNNIYQLGKVHRISVLQLAISKSKKQKESENGKHQNGKHLVTLWESNILETQVIFLK